MSDNFTYTNIDVKGKEFFFTINNKSKYKIPSKIFPIASKSQLTFFTPQSTVEYVNEKLADEINKIDLPMGCCYSNSEKIREIGLDLGIDLIYFSGWILRANDMPKHHAWIAIRHEQGVSIIDSFKDNLFEELGKKYPVDYSNVDWRKKSAIALKMMIKDMPLNSQQIIIGKVPGYMYYVGSPDNSDNSVRLFNKLKLDFPKHPSYQGDGDSLDGRSKFQDEMNKVGLI